MNGIKKEDTESHVYTVSELTQQIKSLLERKFTALWVEGEVSNVRCPSSGHLYFTLKDAACQLPVVMFRDAASLLRFRLEDGLQVLTWGRIAVYRKRGQYQLMATLLEPRGRGALQLALEQLKKELGAGGLFDLEHKKPLPLLPQRIGIVTSPTGAAIRDILQVINRRFENAHIIINPVRVQGDEAAGEIANGIVEFNRLKNIDVILVARGGGSLEDLWPFNEKVVAYSIFNSRIPVISAVGHEIDWTISDLVADVRAPTPSAAAELVVRKKSELVAEIDHLFQRLGTHLSYKLKNLRQRLEKSTKSYVFQDPKRLIRQYQQRVDDLNLQLTRFLKYIVERKQHKVDSLLSQLEMLSPLAVLARGYSFTRRVKDGRIIKSARVLQSGEEVETRLHQGKFTSVVSKIRIED